MRLDFKEERDRDFLSSYKEVLKVHGAKAPYIEKKTLLNQAIQRPAKRFYVSEEQCARIICNMLKGKTTCIKNPLKKLMYKEIYLRVMKLQKSGLSLPEIIFTVINQPAPRFYITLESAQILYYKLIKTRFK